MGDWLRCWEVPEARFGFLNYLLKFPSEFSMDAIKVQKKNNNKKEEEEKQNSGTSLYTKCTYWTWLLLHKSVVTSYKIYHIIYTYACVLF